MTDLLKCPFCGGEAAEMLDEFDEYREKFGDEFNEIGLGASYKAVCCSVNKGGCGAVGGWKPTEAEAIAAWNARAERTCRNVSLDNSQFYCSMCECTVVMPLLWGDLKYCPGCGARVERGDA